MPRDVPRSIFWRLVSTATCLALLALTRVCAVNALGQEPETPRAPPAQPPVEEPAPAGTAAGSTPKEKEKQDEPPPTPDRYLLMQSLRGTVLGQWLDSRKIEVSGWTDMSYTASTAHDSNLPMGFNYRANQFSLQQNWLRIDRPVDTASKEASFGFRSDTIMPGTDYFFTVPRGLLDSQLTANHGQPNVYGFDPVYFYGEAYFPNVAKGMDVKVGRFAAIYGVDPIEAIGSPMASRDYALIYDPFTQTGILTETKIADEWSIQAGLVLGNDNFVDPTDNLTGTGSVKWASKDQTQTLSFYVIVGSGRFDQVHNFHNPDVFDVVYTNKFDPRWKYTFEGLYGLTTNVPNTGFANWFSLVNYLTYDFTSRLSTTARLEFFDDEQGQRTGFPGLYVAPTFGLNFRPNKSITFRPEVRYDNNLETAPFEGKHGLFTSTFDVIFRW